MRYARRFPFLSWGLLGVLALVFGSSGAEAAPRPFSGMALGAPDSRGLLPVVEVWTPSPASEAGMRPGDWLVEIDGDPVMGKGAAPVAAALEKLLHEGFSAVVIFLRNDTPMVARLKTARISLHQQQFLEFRRRYLNAATQSDLLWKEVCEALDQAVFRALPQETLEMLLGEKRQAFRELQREMGALAFPVLGDPRAGAFLAKARDIGCTALRQREEALGVVADYVRRHRGEDVFEKNLWSRMNSYHRTTGHLMDLAERDLLEGLALVAMTDADFDLLLSAESEQRPFLPVSDASVPPPGP